MWIASAQQSREVDRRAQEDYGISAQRLMEAAGTEVFRALPVGQRIVVFCGKGNNGGDGFVVASLAARAGKQVTCLVASDETELSPEALHQLNQARRARVKPIFTSEPNWADHLDQLDSADVIVDALLGTGAKGMLEGRYLQAVLAMNDTDVPVISIDLPTGIDADTGQAMGEAVWAHTTVSFGQPKRCFFTGEGPDHIGILKQVDIGFPPDLLSQATDAFLVDEAWVSDRLPHRWHTSHKGTSGSVAIVAGSRRYRGAAALACLGALRAGAGLVSLIAIEEVCASVAAQLPEVILNPVPESNGTISANGEASELMARSDAVVFGPGLTMEAQDAVAALWRHLDKPAVIDADALNMVANGLVLPPGPCVLTPHPGEMARLSGLETKDILSDRFRHVRAYGKKALILKGANSLVVDSEDPGRPIAVCPAGNPGMATGGMGDVLAGIIGTFLAQGLAPYDAAACGGSLHAAAGDLCLESIGPIGYSPRDLALALPGARAKITSA